MPEGAFASPWTPYRSLFPSTGLNQSVIDPGAAGAAANWQEVVDEVWLSSDSTRGQWLQGHVTYSSPYPHAFIFEAYPELSHLQYRGHIAIDDVKFTQGPCDGNFEKFEILIYIFKIYFWILVECEFNADFCQWTNEVGPDVKSYFKWYLSRGSLWVFFFSLKKDFEINNFNNLNIIDSYWTS